MFFVVFFRGLQHQSDCLQCDLSPLLFIICFSQIIFPGVSSPYFLFSKVLGVQTQLAPRAHWTKQAVEDQSQQLSAATPPSWFD